MNRRIRIQRLAPQDRDEWQRRYYQHQSYAQRRRLKALKAVWDGETLQGVARRQGIRLKRARGQKELGVRSCKITFLTCYFFYGTAITSELVGGRRNGF